eukprot:c14106_g1_i1 orf=103-645(+)
MVTPMEKGMTWAAPIVSLALLLLAHLASRMLALFLRTRRKPSLAEQELASHIKDLLRQANSLSTPSTFAKAAKLKRTAVAKERELIQLRHINGKEQRWSLSWHAVIPKALQTLMYLSLAYWYWGYPLSTVPSQSLHPFDNTITWRTFSCQDRNLTKIGILPWLVICSRVCIILAKKVIPE